MALRHSGVNSAATSTKVSTTKPASESTALEGVAFTHWDVFGKLLSLQLYRFFKDYLNHFGVLLTAIVIVLAYSLRGEVFTVI